MLHPHKTLLAPVTYALLLQPNVNRMTACVNASSCGPAYAGAPVGRRGWGGVGIQQNPRNKSTGFCKESLSTCFLVGCWYEFQLPKVFDVLVHPQPGNAAEDDEIAEPVVLQLHPDNRCDEEKCHHADGEEAVPTIQAANLLGETEVTVVQ